MPGGKKAVVLLSGGVDSVTTLAIAVKEGFEPYALTFRYGQRHVIELEAARRMAMSLGVVEHKIIELDLRSFGGSALTSDIPVPTDRTPEEMDRGIPLTYVPARNTIFLSFALAWAEVLGASDIFFGANAGDYTGYPDCRPEYFQAFERLAGLATKAGVEGQTHLRIHTPVLRMTKPEIIRTGLELKVDYLWTSSCYNPAPDGRPCGKCDACILRRAGFEANGFDDPAMNRPPMLPIGA
jgi:7-cyano-7-deazaguanine synthase